MIHRLLYFLLLGSVTLFSLESFCAERTYTQLQPPRLKPGRLAFMMYGDTFETEKNFTESLKEEDILGDSYKAQNLYFGFEYDFSHYNSFYFGVLSGRSESSISSTNGENSGIKGLEFGGAYKIAESKEGLGLIFDYRYFQNLDENDFSGTDPALGDSTSWLKLGFWAKYTNAEVVSVWGYLGLKHPFQELSTNLLYQAKIELKFSSLRLGGGFEGQVPVVSEDEGDAVVDRRLYIDRANAGSFHYLGVNSQFVDVMGWVGAKFAPFTVFKLGFASPFAGSQTALGVRVFAQLETSFSLTNRGLRFPFPKNRKRRIFKKGSSLKNYKKKRKSP